MVALNASLDVIDSSAEASLRYADDLIIDTPLPLFISLELVEVHLSLATSVVDHRRFLFTSLVDVGGSIVLLLSFESLLRYLLPDINAVRVASDKSSVASRLDVASLLIDKVERDALVVQILLDIWRVSLLLLANDTDRLVRILHFNGTLQVLVQDMI